MLHQNHLDAWTQDERTMTVQRQIAVFTDDLDNELMQLSMQKAPMYTQKQSYNCVYAWAELAQAARVSSRLIRHEGCFQTKQTWHVAINADVKSDIIPNRDLVQTCTCSYGVRFAEVEVKSAPCIKACVD